LQNIWQNEENKRKRILPENKGEANTRIF